MRIVALFFLIFLGSDTFAAEISNLKSGMICRDTEGNESVCEQAEDIYVTGESLCDWSGEQRRCTWFGFQFDYENADPEIPIICEYERSAPSTEGNYEGVRQHKATTGSSSFTLSAISGHFYNPMYQLFSEAPGADGVVITTYLDCSIGGTDVFDITFRLHFAPG